MKRTDQPPAESVKRVTYLSILLNFILSATKAMLGFLGGSSAVIADAVHSLSDLVSDLAVLIGVRLWVRPADAGHPYGHQKIEALVSGIIGLMLLFSGVQFLRRTYEVLVEPRGAKMTLVAALGPLITIVIKEVLYHRTMYIGKRTNSAALKSNAWHHRSDAFSSIPVLLVVLFGVLYPQVSHYADALGTFVVAVIIINVSVKIIKEAVDELLDGNAEPGVESMIRQVALGCPGVEGIHSIRCMRVGSTIRTDFHIMISQGMDLTEAHEIGTMVRTELQRSDGRFADIMIQVEPSELCKT